MYTWPGTLFNGDRYKFENYLEVLTQQLRANNCLKIAKNEEETQQQQQQQQHGGNSPNAWVAELKFHVNQIYDQCCYIFKSYNYTNKNRLQNTQ